MADRQDIDALIVGALYGEIDADERARLDAHLSSHPEDRAALEALEATRQQVRRGIADMPSAEPSPRISTMLLAAAQQAHAHATPGTRENRAVAADPPGQGLWSRFVEWMRPLAGHPAFAGAAVLVLVAGTATALWMRDKGRVSEPQVAEHRAAEPAETASTAGSAAGAPSNEALPAQPPALAQVDEQARFEGKAETVTPGYRLDGNADKGGLAAAGSKPQKAPPAKKKAASDIGMMEVTTKGDEVAIKDLEEEKAPAPADDAVADGRNAKESVSKTSTAQYAQPAPEPKAVDPKLEEWAKGQHKKLAKLVADGKCPAAGRVGADIKDKAPEYYAANIANDRAIRACKSYIEGQSRKKADKNYKSRSGGNTADEELDASQ